MHTPSKWQCLLGCAALMIIFKDKHTARIIVQGLYTCAFSFLGCQQYFNYKMDNKHLETIYKILEFDLLEQFEYPCDNCNYFECEKNILNQNNIIRKRYKWNDINWRSCLKNKKKDLQELIGILRLNDFKRLSHEECIMCKKKFFKHDMKLYSETAKEEVKHKKFSGYEVKIFRLCKRCNKSYVHRKGALHDGFRRM